MQSGAGNDAFPAVLDEPDICQSQTEGHEDLHGLYNGRHAIDESGIRHSMTLTRVFCQRGTSQFRGKQSPDHWFSNLNLSQSHHQVMLGGGIFLLFFFIALLPVQFYDKLKITHKSDGKKRPL